MKQHVPAEMPHSVGSARQEDVAVEGRIAQAHHVVLEGDGRAGSPVAKDMSVAAPLGGHDRKVLVEHLEQQLCDP